MSEKRETIRFISVKTNRERERMREREREREIDRQTDNGIRSLEYY